MVVFFIVMLVFRGGTKTFSQRCVWTFCSHLNFHHEKDIDSKEFWGTELGQMFFLWRIRIISIGWYWHFSLDICKDVTMMFPPSLPWLFLRWFPFETPGNMTWNLGSHTHTQSPHVKNILQIGQVFCFWIRMDPSSTWCGRVTYCYEQINV